MVALNSANGAIRWSRGLPSPSESSPLVDHGRLFFGSQSGIVYALNDRNGSVLWTYHAAGAVKASPTLSGGVLYFGDYSGHVQAISEQTGRRLWVSGSEGALLGSGTFYSTAAVVYGRVFLGNTDGRIYAYDASTGQARLGGADRRLRLRLARRHQRPRPRADRLPRLLRRHLLRAQRPLGPDQLAASTPAGASPARRRSSGAPSTSPTSATTAPTAWASPPAACCSRWTPARSTR